MKNHIDSGTALLAQMFQETGRSGDGLIRRLVDEVEFAGRREQLGSGLDIFIGRTLLQRAELVMELNNTAKHANSHLAIMGKPGVGKTQFLLKISDRHPDSIKLPDELHLLRLQGRRGGQRALSGIGARATISTACKAGRACLSTRSSCLLTTSRPSTFPPARKAESFASINSKLGVVQKGALTEAIRAAYAKRAGAASPYPDFQDVFEIAVAAYEADGKKDDSLIEVLRDLSDFDLFWRHGSETPPMDRVSNRTMLIDVHAMPVLKELVAYLVIERLYKEMATLPDSPVTEDRRTIRTILVIDEAHNYLGQKNIFLQRIIREGRSKGVVVFFASQSPNDYQQKFFNFQELLEFAYIFQCDGVTSGSVQDILGCSAKTAKELQTEVARLEPWQVIARSQEKTEEFVKFTAEAFYKSYA